MSHVKRLGDLALSDNGFAFDPRTGATFTINATGVCVLGALKEGLGRADIGARVRERFEAHHADVDRDVDDFIALLRQNGILAEDAVV